MYIFKTIQNSLKELDSNTCSYELFQEIELNMNISSINRPTTKRKDINDKFYYYS